MRIPAQQTAAASPGAGVTEGHRCGVARRPRAVNPPEPPRDPPRVLRVEDGREEASRAPREPAPRGRLLRRLAKVLANSFGFPLK